MQFKKICALILFVSFSFSYAQTEWQFVTDNPPNVYVFSTCRINNTVYFWCDRNIVYRTTDGGASFETFLPYAPVENTTLGCCWRRGIAFADSLTGYITDIAHGEFRTEDGGKTWTKMADPGSSHKYVVFGSSKVGWKVGWSVYKTYDAGKTWQSLSVPFWEGGYYSNVFALDEYNVWVLKSYYTESKPEGSIWHSTNGGYSWVRLQTGLTSSDSLHVYYYNLLMRPDSHGIAIGRIHRPHKNEYKAFIQKTEDFGKTWTTFEFPDMDLRTILAINDSTWIVLGNVGKNFNFKIIQLKSIDGGNSWMESNPFPQKFSSYTNKFWSAEYVPKYGCILASTLQGIYKSVDHGESYFPITTKRELYAKEVIIERNPVDIDSQMIFVRSYNREYLLSTDAGRSWIKKEIPANLGYEIWHVKIAKGTIYIVVDQDKLYKSNDKGENWTRINPTSSYSGLLGLDALDENTAVIESYQFLNTTTDGGNSWLATPYPSNFWLNDCFMHSADEISGIGVDLTDYPSKEKGFFFYTIDKGFSWRIQSVDHPVEYFTFPSNKTGFALNKYRIFKTTNGGYSWNEILATTKNFGQFSSLCFFDSLQGLVHSGLTFIQTNDGGATWEKVPWKFFYEFAEQLAVNGKGDVFAVAAGSLFKYPNFFSPLAKQTTDTINKNNLAFQISPNPFNSQIKIQMNLTEPKKIDLKIYNLQGQLIKTLFTGSLTTGNHTFHWDATNNQGVKLSSGMYFLTISVDEQIQSTFKLILIR